VDKEFYHPASFTEPRKRFSFFSLSSLTYAKGVMDLVEAFDIAVQKDWMPIFLLAVMAI
jgi:hypothetical protein